MAGQASDRYLLPPALLLLLLLLATSSYLTLASVIEERGESSCSRTLLAPSGRAYTYTYTSRSRPGPDLCARFAAAQAEQESEREKPGEGVHYCRDKHRALGEEVR